MVIILLGCKTSSPPAAIDASEEQEEVKITASPWLQYNQTPSQYIDLEHVSLDLSFNWEKRQVIGTASLIGSPYFYPLEYVRLDAKDFDSITVSLIRGSDTLDLAFEYDDITLSIQLDREYQNNEEFILQIGYIANPYRNSTPENRGLFFVNHDGQNPFLSRQIWTQGETEYNSYWYPTIDYPNEKYTQEIKLTVNKSYSTLSNGRLVSSQQLGNGYRRDHWKMENPHSPYLSSIVIGEFDIVEDSLGMVPIKYWVDPGFDDAHRVFGQTPEMIDYFSMLLDYPYPWTKYDQIIVKQFVTGAMENTSASTFMDALHSPLSSMNDENWDYIIAHELAHQWFGNLVTAESWSNISLNESLANLFEYIWIEYKYGIEEKEYAMNVSLDQYLLDSEEIRHPLFWTSYNEPDDVFDSHSYEKGAAVLNMLKLYVGEKAFFAGLNHYLRTNAFKTVEFHDLRQAFEHVVGEDLTWFFRQWFENPGHPVLNVTHNFQYDTLFLEIFQDQDLSIEPLYYLPIHLDLIWADQIKRYPLDIFQQYHKFRIPLDKKPIGIIVDGEYQLVGEINHSKKYEELRSQFLSNHSFMARYEALTKVGLGNYSVSEKKEMLKLGLNDSSRRIQELALDLVNTDTIYQTSEFFTRIAESLNSQWSFIRAGAIEFLVENNRLGLTELEDLLADQSHYVQGLCIQYLLSSEYEKKSNLYHQFKEFRDINIIVPLAIYLNDNPTPDSFSWYEEKIWSVESGLDYLINLFSEYLINGTEEEKVKGSEMLFQLALDHHLSSTRLTAFTGLVLLEDVPGNEAKIESIRALEKSEELQRIYKSY